MDKKSSGFTFIELIIVIAILGIIAAIAVPRLTGFKGMAEERMCAANRETAKRMYSAFLIENEHSDIVFNQFLIENFGDICISGGVASYENGKINCSIHEDEPHKDEVPWL